MTASSHFPGSNRYVSVMRHTETPVVIRLVLLAAAFTATSVHAQIRGKPKPAVFPPLTTDQAAKKQQVLASLEVDSTAAARRPNIVLLLADDLGYADIGCFGSKTIPTPHIDKLAARGVSFTNAYVTAGTCSPSRAGLLTGRYQNHFGFEFNTGSKAVTTREGRGLDPSAITIADVMRRAGYSTGIVGKWHLGTRKQFHPLERGFDEFFGFLAGAHTFITQTRLSKVERSIQGGRGDASGIHRGMKKVDETEYLTDAFAREAVGFVERHKAERFFLYVPFNAVHTPIQATKKYVDRFEDVPDLKRRTYYAMTSALDDAVGRIVDALKRNKLEDDTLVIFCNDNGGPVYTGVQDNGPLRLGKLFLFEGGVRVPLVMRWPGVIPENEVRDNIVSTLDLFPTLSRIAGATPPNRLGLHGVDLSAWLRGTKASPAREPLFWRNGPNKAMRRGKWKLIQVPGHVWLFDLEADVGEQTNLAGKRPDVTRQMQQKLARWEKRMRAPSWPARPARRDAEVDGVPYRVNI